MNTAVLISFRALVKREYWEHRGSMFYTPAIMAAVFAGLMVFASITGGSLVVNDRHESSVYSFLLEGIGELQNIKEEQRESIVQGSLYGVSILFAFVMFIIGLFYALGSLYDERKDRSILFWKSLPISDTETVLSKFFSVCLSIPVVYFSVILIFQLFLLLFTTVGAWFGGSSGVTIWASSNLFSVVFNSLFALVVASLWLAPIWGWLMLASSWAKKVAFLWGLLPIFMLSMAELYVFHSSRFIELLVERVGYAFVILLSNMESLVKEDMLDGHSMHWYEVFANMEFWGGLVVSAVFLAGAVFTRRHRDES